MATAKGGGGSIGGGATAVKDGRQHVLKGAKRPPHLKRPRSTSDQAECKARRTDGTRWERCGYRRTGVGQALHARNHADGNSFRGVIEVIVTVLLLSDRAGVFEVLSFNTQLLLKGFLGTVVRLWRQNGRDTIGHATVAVLLAELLAVGVVVSRSHRKVSPPAPRDSPCRPCSCSWPLSVP